MHRRRVVVTGIGALTPIGNTKNAFWGGLLSGTSGAAPITYFDASMFKTQFACEIKNFDAREHFDRKEARKMDRFTQYAMVASDEAVNDAGLELEKIDKSRVGVIWGSGVGGLETFQNEVLNFADGNGTPRFNPFFIPKMIADIAPGMISIKYGFRGPNFATVSACASSANAIIDALNYIRLGYSDIMVTGGSEAGVAKASIGGFNAMHALSVRNDDPKTASRPFDKDRDGFVMGEGAGALVLESLEHAQARGATIYAEVAGGGLSADAHHITAPHPEGEGARKVMRDAVNYAGLDLSEIDYINVHGTSTPLGDEIELRAVERAFDSAVEGLSMSSTKSSTGHLLGASGAIESIFSILSIKNSIVPPTLNLENISKDCDGINLVPHESIEKEVNYSLSNSFGFGGTNASLIFKRI